MDERIALLLIPALQDPPSGRKRAKSPPEESREVHEAEPDTMPKAA
jgi:hypothetical protein